MGFSEGLYNFNFITKSSVLSYDGQQEEKTKTSGEV